jgi:hypothetical protein
MTNPNTDRRRMTLARSYREEAQYYREVIPWCQEEDKASWERAAQKRIEEAERLENQVHQVLKGEREE